MASNKCVLCNKKKGKRLCPMRSGKICTSCCGQQIADGRMCVSTCTYRTNSLEYKREKESIKKNINPVSFPVDKEVFVYFIENLERNIYKKIVTDSYYEDHHLHKALDRVISQYKAGSLGTDVLLNRVGVLESLIKESIGSIALKNAKFSSETIVTCLIIYQKTVHDFSKNNAGTRAYIQVLLKRIDEHDKEVRQSSLIL
ncbi:MAG: hypothetical protein ACMUIP_11595 [bacterium]